jgi:hypothetical protein
VLDYVFIKNDTGDVFRKEDGSFVTISDERAEAIRSNSVYERDKQLWVQQAIQIELANQSVLLTDTQIENRTKYYSNAYDLMQDLFFDQ